MCKKAVIMSVLLGACLVLPQLVLADEVLITKTGNKYHQNGCPLVANRQTTSISLEEAKAKELEPCLKCADKDVVKETSDQVFITKSGSKYHTANCPLIKNRDKTSISLSEAQAEGLEPCGKCMAKGKKLSKKTE
jgi:hypothetical protein